MQKLELSEWLKEGPWGYVNIIELQDNKGEYLTYEITMYRKNKEFQAVTTGYQHRKCDQYRSEWCYSTDEALQILVELIEQDIFDGVEFV